MKKAKTKRLSKWIRPEKRMKTYRDYGIKDNTPSDDPKWKKVKWVDFRILVPDEETKRQLQAACEYLHDNRLIDTDFLAVNSLVHSYLTPERESGVIDQIIVDPIDFKLAKQKTCHHTGDSYVLDGMKYCSDCDKMLEVTSYRY